MGIEMLGSRPQPHEVFTPRSHELNSKTYANRPVLENRLSRALRGHKYAIIHGESGNGKTWLYKKVLESANIPYTVVNLARMHTEGSLNAVLSLKLGELGFRDQKSETQEVNAAVYKQTYTYEGRPIGMIEAIGQAMKSKYGNKLSIVVLDNFEQPVYPLDPRLTRAAL